MSNWSDELLIKDMLDNAEAVFQFVGVESYDSFINNREKVYAVIRAFEIISEASKMVSEDIKQLNPFVEWRLLGDFRNVLIHHYFGIDYEELWSVIKDSLPYNNGMLKLISFG